MEHIEKNIKPYEPSFTTMVPTNVVRFFRTCLIWQFIRFIIINIKMLQVVRKSHH
ncbi:hypothetical protein [Hydrogenimonas urashimensis]|uniref:hypothetical protein n=1 Tax=Hydrogenimonas urashimensis TaxID=2740515 RepID=UPI00191696B3|nr:hypothetical protein [Hydrogenimonas urashimensis]